MDNLSSDNWSTCLEYFPRCILPPMATLDTERIRRMSAAGLTTREIASALGCSHSRIGQILAQYGPLSVPPVSIHASEGQIVIKTDSPQIVGVAIKRALERAGIEVKPPA